MDTDSHVFSSWEEHIVSSEKGQRVVHFYLKDTSGELILAVVGTEKSSRKMLYVVSEDYLDAFGHTSTINSDTKWRAKKHVVEWLTFLISKHHGSPPISNTPRREKRSASMDGHRSNEVSQNITKEDSSRQGPRGSRSVSESDHSASRKSIPGNRIAQGKPPTYPKLKIKFPHIGPAGIQIAEPQHKPSFEVGDNLEVLCHDSGMKGCWFRCKVLQVSQKRLKVQYDDILDCDGLEKLEEWIPSDKVTGSDKLGVRCTGRLTVRPRPLEDSSHHSFEVGAGVDAWWSDGCWEGVVAGFDASGRDHLQVYFPGENILLEIHRKNVRTSRDWVDDKWIEVEGKKDIKLFIKPENCENQMAPKLVASEDNKMASTSKPSTEKQDSCVLKLKKDGSSDMATEIELANQCVPINEIPQNSAESVMCVFVLRRGSIIPYNNSRHEGTYRTIILVDAEGTKIQATQFNKHIETWKDSLAPNKSYYILNGRLDRVNPNYSSVHKEFELSFTDNTIIKECSQEVSPNKFYAGFISLAHAETLPSGTTFVLVKPLIEIKYSKLHEIIITNELMEHTTVTLWGDFAENDGAFLEKLKDDKPILGLCDVKASMYKGTFCISTIPVCSVLINPVFEKAMDLRAWREGITAEKKDITLTPTKVMKRALQVPLMNILDGLLAASEDCFYKFTANIFDILNRDQPWYSCCKKCRKKVQIIEQIAACTNCKLENVDYEMRYCLRLEVYAGEHRARVVLLEAAENLVGCGVQDYIQSTSFRKEKCPNYRKLLSSKDKSFTFLVRIDLNNSNPRRTLVAQEIHRMEAATPPAVEEETKPKSPLPKHLNKATEEAETPNTIEEVATSNRQRTKRLKKATKESETPNIVEEDAKSVSPRRKRVKKPTAKALQRNHQKIQSVKK